MCWILIWCQFDEAIFHLTSDKTLSSPQISGGKGKAQRRRLSWQPINNQLVKGHTFSTHKTLYRIFSRPERIILFPKIFRSNFYDFWWFNIQHVITSYILIISAQSRIYLWAGLATETAFTTSSRDWPRLRHLSSSPHLKIDRFERSLLLLVLEIFSVGNSSFTFLVTALFVATIPSQSFPVYLLLDFSRSRHHLGTA